jgi:hypothetical protein
MSRESVSVHVELVSTFFGNRARARAAIFNDVRLADGLLTLIGAVFLLLVFGDLGPCVLWSRAHVFEFLVIGSLFLFI